MRKSVALLYRLLVSGLGADSNALDFERNLPEVRGRIDALLGRTIFEIKRTFAAREEMLNHNCFAIYPSENWIPDNVTLESQPMAPNS